MRVQRKGEAHLREFHGGIIAVYGVQVPIRGTVFGFGFLTLGDDEVTALDLFQDLHVWLIFLEY